MAQVIIRGLRPRLTFSRLRFSGDLESSFADYFFEHRLVFARFAIVLAIVLYALFGILDLFIVPDVARSLWVIRYAIFCPIALAVLGLSFTSWFKSVMQPILCVLAVISGLGIVAMIAIASAAGGYFYYAGLLLVIPSAYTVLQLRFSYATAACATIVVGYEIVALWVKPPPLDILINNNFFFLSSLIISMLAGYTIERGLRTDFLQRQVIETQRAELAVHNVDLDSALQASLEDVRRQADELQASRARIVAAADAERRRIERNLHDGAQQHLAGLAIQLRLVSKLGDGEGERRQALLGQLEEQVRDTIQELRTLAHGIYPPLLMDQGLSVALAAVARRSTLPTTVEALALRRYTIEVEASMYFCCLEALQNACKHAGEGATVKIRVEENAGRMDFEVADDGVGFDPQVAGLGAGFVNMSDRLGALGGTVRVESAPGRGTRVVGTVPVAEGTHSASGGRTPGGAAALIAHTPTVPVMPLPR